MPKDSVNNPLNHLGIIMDGNRRWAAENGLKPMDGHARGYKNLKNLAIHALTVRKIPYMSAFIFSTENWSRTQEEVSYLMRLITRGLEEYLDEFHQKGIKILVLGSTDKLSPKVIKAIDKAVSKTRRNSNGTLALCFNYGGQQEIVDAVKKMTEKKISPEETTPERFSDFLYHPEVPPIDLLVRTSGEQRLSGFMLWRAAYAELYFVDKYWPDFNSEDMDSAVDEYARRLRRYGR